MQTLLFRDVVEVETGQPLRDHVWLREGPWWATGGLNMVGVTVDMTVTIGPVIKGCLGDPYSARAIELDLPSPLATDGFSDPTDLWFPVDSDGLETNDTWGLG